LFIHEENQSSEQVNHPQLSSSSVVKISYSDEKKIPVALQKTVLESTGEFKSVCC